MYKISFSNIIGLFLKNTKFYYMTLYTEYHKQRILNTYNHIKIQCTSENKQIISNYKKYI